MICVYVPQKGRTSQAQVDTYEALEAHAFRRRTKSKYRERYKNGTILKTQNTTYVEFLRKHRDKKLRIYHIVTICVAQLRRFGYSCDTM